MTGAPLVSQLYDEALEQYRQADEDYGRAAKLWAELSNAEP